MSEWKRCLGGRRVARMARTLVDGFGRDAPGVLGHGLGGELAEADVGTIGLAGAGQAFPPLSSARPHKTTRLGFLKAPA